VSEQFVSGRETHEAVELRGFGDFWEEQRERVLVEIFDKLIEDLF
jgi:hypothetical protein